MEPTLHDGQVIAVDRHHYRRHPLRPGDVVVFDYDGMVQVKRVHALPGARVWEVHYDSEESAFLLNPRTLDRARWLLGRQPGAAIRSRDVPSGTLYVLGDGGNSSYDSRYYGPIPASAVIGKALLRDEGGRAAVRAVERATLDAGG